MCFMGDSRIWVVIMIDTIRAQDIYHFSSGPTHLRCDLCGHVHVPPAAISPI